MSFENLGLSPVLLRALADAGYTQPTPVQSSAIPVALAGHDVIASAQTGTGKTAAFALPLLDRLITRAGAAASRRPRVLVLTPTRELAAQVQESVRGYARHTRIKSTAVFGGVGMGAQMSALERGVDVVVATPGRLIDHLDRRSVDLSRVELCVLDEADRMLDMGFLPAMKRILGALPAERQTLLFSATFAPEVKALAAQFMRAPVEVEVARNTVAATVTHRVHPVDSSRKRDLLIELLAQDSRVQTLVFARTKHGADRLAHQLEQRGFRAAAIHGDKTQGARTRALSDFKNGRATILVATDIAARGLDIEQLPRVVNYELPMVAEDYVHRIGRTGRAGCDGLAVSLVCADESDSLRQIQRLLKAPIECVAFPGFEPVRPLRLDDPRAARGLRRPGPAAHARRPHARSDGPHHAAGHKRRRENGPRGSRNGFRPG